MDPNLWPVSIKFNLLKVFVNYFSLFSCSGEGLLKEKKQARVLVYLHLSFSYLFSLVIVTTGQFKSKRTSDAMK